MSHEIVARARSFLSLSLVAVAALGFAGCSDADSDPLGGPGTGRLTVNLHDQAAPGISQAWITVESVQAVTADGGFENVQGVTLGTAFDLATLVNGNQVTLAAGALPAGEYTGLRITVSAITLVLDDGTSVDALGGLPGIGVRVQVSFTVVDGQDIVIGLDLPLSAFELRGGRWTFDPTRVTVD